MKGETQRNVNILYGLYNTLYILFDKTIYHLDKPAINSDQFPKWFMTAVSTFGLGFQLLIMGVMLVLGWKDYIILFFISYSTFIFVFIGIRRWLNR